MTSPTTPFECPICDGGTVRLAKIPYAIEFRGKEYVVPEADVMVCDKCGEVFFAAGQSDALQRRASDMARRDMGLLTGAEISAFRKENGLTQAQFERALGAPPKSLARWEIGTVLQSHTVDTFLRVLMAHPALLAELLEPTRAPSASTVPADRHTNYSQPPRPQPKKRRTYACPQLALAA
ncbi:MAG: type II toxin-antitoxin system MqsA family antitoxin [Actinomycetia bacterium]|nr:type II toxin-antitoxin system MqsA family antitoxin [Actinomycetes bacterium]